MAAKHNLGDQFIDIYHASERPDPPHTRSGGSPIFAGTREAALDRAAESDRQHIHHYRIPKRMVRPELWADDDYPAHEDTGNVVHRLADPPGATLWEGVPVSTTGLKQGEILQYRNHAEDVGSISYVFHKHDAEQGKIKYLGSENLNVSW